MRGSVYKTGTSRTITIPHFWLRMLEEREGEKVVAVELTIMNDSLVVEPVFEENQDHPA